MKKLGYILGFLTIFCGLGLLTGCASTTVFPLGHNKYSLVASSSSQGSAESAAKSKAQAVCKKHGKHLVVLSHRTKYQGVNKSDKAMMNIAGAVLAGDPAVADSNSDYKVTMKFACR